MATTTQKSGLTFKHKVGYAMGDLGGCMTFALMGAMVTRYYTNVLQVNTAVLATLLLVWNIWDAVNDPMMGALMDKMYAKHHNKNGKFRPWLLRAAPLLAITSIVFWTVPTLFDGYTMLVVLFFCKILYEGCYTMFNIPMGSLLSAMANTDGEQVNYAVNIDEALPMLNANNVPYTMAGGVSWVVWLAAGLLAAAAVAVAAALVVKGRKKAAPAPVPTPPTPPAPAASNDSGYRLQGVAGVLEGRRFALPASGQLILGRDPNRCTVVLPANTAGVSGCHCAVWVENGELFLKDMGSTHGTFVTPGSRLAGGQAIRIRPGEAFWLGSQAQTFVVAERRPG